MEPKDNIFIIYSRKDEGEDSLLNWVTSFQRFLKLLLERLGGKSVQVSLLSDEEFNVGKTYSSSTIIIPICSLNLLESGVFKDEIKKFHEKAIQKESNTISWSNRVFKVFRYPVSGHFLLDFLNDSNSYKFFHFDKDTNKVVSYNDFTGEESQKTFWLRLYDLAYDINKTNEKLESVEDEIDSLKDQINVKSIYLAEVGEDLMHERDTIKRELNRLGYKVIPESPIGEDAEVASRNIKKEINRAILSIHLIGNDPVLFRGSTLSMVEMQSEIADQHFQNERKLSPTNELESLGRLVWISPEITQHNIRQRLFVENLKKDAFSIENAEIIESPLEEFKLFLNNRLQSFGKEVEFNLYSSNQESRGKVIYLICDSDGLTKSEPLRQYLSQVGYEVITSNLEGDPDKARIIHNENLQRCDATLIYAGNENKQWIKSKLNDLMKSLGLGREKPISPQAVLFDEGFGDDNSLKFDKDAIVLYNKGDFSPETIQPFLAKLEN